MPRERERQGETIPGGHRLIIDGAPGVLRTQYWWCACGRWQHKPTRAESDAPTETIRRLRASHGAHLREVGQ